jgi:hypothetical protein
MDVLHLRGTEETPEVIFDPEASRFLISGKSYMEDANAFYGPVVSWLKSYAENPLSNTVFNFNIEYLNTASSKMLHDILDILDQIHQSGRKLSIVWGYYEDDEDMQELGEEYAEGYGNLSFTFTELHYDHPDRMFEGD